MKSVIDSSRGYWDDSRIRSRHLRDAVDHGPPRRNCVKASTCRPTGCVPAGGAVAGSRRSEAGPSMQEPATAAASYAAAADFGPSIGRRCAFKVGLGLCCDGHRADGRDDVLGEQPRSGLSCAGASGADG